MARVDEAVGRILQLKREANFSTDPLPETTIVGSAAHRDIEREIAGKAIAILRDRQNLLPLDANAPITLVNTTERSAYATLTKTRGIGPNQATPAFDVLAGALDGARQNLRVVAAEDFSSADLPESGVIIAVTENYTLPGMDFDRSRQAEIVGALHAAAGERLIVMALCEPYELAGFPDIAGYICAISFRPCAALAAADVLLGRASARGKSPVTVPGTEVRA